MATVCISHQKIAMTATSSSTIINRAQEWCDWDPNETTAAYLQDLINRATDTDTDTADNEHLQLQQQLAALFPEHDRIGFGTAGLRAAMEIGPLSMNDLVVVQTAQGIARYCQAQLFHPEQELKIVIGYDHRANIQLQLSSLSFAILSTLVFQHAGIECILLDGLVMTPLVPFATLQLDATVGIMVTASHNPKEDAGYKVYWGDGCQIRPPLDSGIAAAILENLTPWTDYKSLLLAKRRRAEHSDSSTSTFGLSNPTMTALLRSQYFQAVQQSGLISGQAVKFASTTTIAVPPRFCYTAMHGVGHSFAKESFAIFGLPPFSSVPQQENPDPNFTTVSFPNPEENGALDLAKAHAQTQNCDIVLANDPDADRLAVAEKNRDTGEWTVFTGDQIGALLGSWMWEIMGKTSDKPIAMCASTVSSRLLAEMARVEGFHFEDTLTGFKWIGSRASTLNNEEGYRSIFCYEEAIGFCCGDIIFDKDGISAMGVFAEMAYHAYNTKGCCSLVNRLQQIYDKYGEFVSNNGYYFFDDKLVIVKILDEIRNDGNYLPCVGKYPVESIRDLGEPGYDSTKADQKPTLPTSNSSPMITISFMNGCVAQFRASGTEPKFKYYIEMKGEPGVSRDVVQQELMEMSSILLETLLRPEENGLTKNRSKL